MDALLTIEREIDLELSTDELWELISTGTGWQQWLVDDASIVVAEGAEGVIVDDGVERLVRVAEVVDGRSVTFHWSERGADDDLSAVTLEIVELARGGVRLHVSEQWLAPNACADCPMRAQGRWDLRECVLCIGASAACRV